MKIIHIDSISIVFKAKNKKKTTMTESKQRQKSTKEKLHATMWKIQQNHPPTSFQVTQNCSHNCNSFHLFQTMAHSYTKLILVFISYICFCSFISLSFSIHYSV